MEVKYNDHQISVRVSQRTESIDRKYLEDFLSGSLQPIKDSFDNLIGIDIQRS
jgi:hypothetical protein